MVVRRFHLHLHHHQRRRDGIARVKGTGKPGRALRPSPRQREVRASLPIAASYALARVGRNRRSTRSFLPPTKIAAEGRSIRYQLRDRHDISMKGAAQLRTQCPATVLLSNVRWLRSTASRVPECSKVSHSPSRQRTGNTVKLSSRQQT